MNFRELIETLSKHIGQHHLPLNPGATQLRGFIDSSAVHYELVNKIVLAIYNGNCCRRLTDSVTCDATFEALEPIRIALLSSSKTDVDAYELMEALCAETAQIFHIPPTLAPVNSSGAGGRLYPFRRRLRFSS